jgi:hypothetical protein
MDPAALDIKAPSPAPSIRMQALDSTAIVSDIRSALGNGSLLSQLIIHPDGSTETLKARFKRLADTWKKDTRFVSSLRQKVNHPAYQEIIRLKTDAIQLILRDLDDRPTDWLPALNEITGEDPVQDGATFEEAVRAWLQWGRKLKYL